MSILEIELKTLSERFVDKLKDHNGTIYLTDGNGKRKFKIEKIKTTSTGGSSKSTSSRSCGTRSSGTDSRGGITSRPTSSRSGSGKSSGSKSRKGSNPLDDITRFVNRLPQ